MKPTNQATDKGDTSVDVQPATDAVVDSQVVDDVDAGLPGDGTATSSDSGITATPDGSPACAGMDCDDNNACTNDTCTDGKCQHVDSGCDDGNLCTDDSCDNSVKACGHVANTLLCDDGNACTEKDICDKSACKPGAGKACDDSDTCTDDSCEASTGQCVHAKKAGCVTALPPCDINAKITCSKGVCDESNHVCVPCLKSKDCGDAGYVCSQQKCVSAATCQSGTDCKATKQVCNKADGVCVDCVTTDDCGTDQKCVEFTCVAAPKCKSDKDCDGVCDTKVGICVGCIVSADCAGGKYCSTWGNCVPVLCSGTTCGSKYEKKCGGAGCVSYLTASAWFGCKNDGSGYKSPDLCNDLDPCTDDTCSAEKGCTPIPSSGSFCNDGVNCTFNDICTNGECKGTANDESCDDGQVCTNDACNMVTGCQHSPADVSCDDGIACTASDSCKQGKCVGQPQSAMCDDKEPCTVDTCEATGCLHSKAPDNTPCDDGSLCSVADKCSGGKCIPGDDGIFVKVYNGVHFGNAVTAVGDEGMVMAGGSDPSNNSNYIAKVVRLDKLAESAQWTWDAYNGEATSVVGFADGFAVATTPTFNINERVSFLSNQGKEMWTTVLPFAAFFLDKPRLVAQGNNLWFAANSSGVGGYFDNSESDFAVGVLDGTGKIVWSKMLPSAGSDEAGGACAAPDGGLVVVGSTWTKSTSFDARMVRVDATGNTVWAKVLSTPDDEILSAVAPLPDGTFVAVGYAYEANSTAVYHAWMVRLSASGDVLWQKTDSGWKSSYSSVAAMPDGGFVTVGSQDGSWVQRRNAYGDVMWSTPTAWYGGSLSSVAVTPSGSLVGSGTQVSPYYKGYISAVFRLDPWGNTDCGKTGLCAGATVQDCDDGQSCTIDLCSSSKGCVHEPAADGSICGPGKVCSLGKCT